MSRPVTGKYTEKVNPKAGDLVTVQEYRDLADSGAIMNSDGFGRAVKDGMEDDRYEVELRPRKHGADIPQDATHVMWYNK